MKKRFFHGGAPKLREILPPATTGAPTTADFGAAGVCNPEKVYCTTEFSEAMVFAAFYPIGRGMIYEVEPEGTIEPDPDYFGPGICVQADRARIIKSFPMRWKDILKIRKANL